MKRLFAFFTEHTPFLRWWLMFTAICVGTYFAFNAGFIQKFFEVDITHISLLIFAIFILFSFMTGYDTYKIGKRGCTKGTFNRTQTGWFFSDALMTLGMLGTVVGFIMMLSGNITRIRTTKINKNTKPKSTKTVRVKPKT